MSYDKTTSSPLRNLPMRKETNEKEKQGSYRVARDIFLDKLGDFA
jgi:hypothetical protein